MTLEDINTILGKIENGPKREHVFELAFALLRWMGIAPNKDEKPQLLAPQTQKLNSQLVPAPVTGQEQLYRLSADGMPVRVRLAVLKKIRKDNIALLVDNDPGLTSYQAAMKGIIQQPGRPPYISPQPYHIHLITTPAYDRLTVVLNKGEQKRIIAFRNKLTQTQFNKILPQWQNIAAKNKPEIDNLLWKSLDLKEVNKDFYRLVKTHFDALIGIAAVQYKQADEASVKQFAVRLIGRYIFCWFLKEKEIIPGSLLVSSTIQQHKTIFFQQALTQLFFNTLNAEVQSPERKLNSTSPLHPLYQNIPYLNGGLFEKHPEDFLFDKLDLNDWLIAFAKTLEDFDFTVDESSSLYQQVAIDPEMLGRIFENLLASQNEETADVANNKRNAFGAFYTPREIVDYMVNESLKAHIESRLLPAEPTTTNVLNEPAIAYGGTLFAHLEAQQTMATYDAGIDTERDKKKERIKAKIEKLFEPTCTENPFDKSETGSLRKALQEVKVLDPACGSGAFPMGVLLRLMELRQIVGHGHKNNYELKSEILSHNIFGVDIMPMAVEIARLRAWLSLVLEAEYKPADSKNNFGIAALPNLDFKFICTNSLIDSGYDKFLENVPLNATLMRLDGEIQKLERLRDGYYDPKGDKARKAKLQQDFLQTKEYIKTEFQSLRKSWNLDGFLNKVDDWDPFDDTRPSSFFSPAWMFGLRDGFDVVIGNPPYVQLQNDGGKLAKLYEGEKYKTFARTGDIYSLFYERGFQVLQHDGILAFITSNKWMKAAYGESLRKYLTDGINPLWLIDFGSNPVFEATVDTNILIAEKSNYQNNINTCVFAKDTSLVNLGNYIKEHAIIEKGFRSNSWVVLSGSEASLRRKIEKAGTKLKDWDVEIFRGILTGFNEAFIIDGTKRADLLSKCPRADDIIKPILLGKDIKRYRYEWESLWLINSHNGIKNKGVPPINLMTDYPAIFEHLCQYKTQLEKRLDKGLHWTNLRNCAYLEDFDKPKIAWGNLALHSQFSYVPEGFFINAPSPFFATENLYLLAILNSTLGDYFIKQLGVSRSGGYIEYKPMFVEQLPVPEIPELEQLPFIKLVEEIIEKKKNRIATNELEDKIDELVFELYGLTTSEKEIIMLHK